MSDIEAKTETKNDEHERLVEIWKVAVETQMHFNEMSVKSRQLGLTFVAAALGVAVVLFTRQQDFSLTLFDGFQLHASVVLILGAALATLVVKALDLNVYHRMLRGAVTFGEDFEENYLKKIFALEKGMTQAISHYSRYSDASVCKMDNGKYRYKGGEKVSAEKKLRLFYRNLVFWLFATALILFVITNQKAILAIWSGAA